MSRVPVPVLGGGKYIHGIGKLSKRHGASAGCWTEFGLSPGLPVCTDSSEFSVDALDRKFSILHQNPFSWRKKVQKPTFLL